MSRTMSRRSHLLLAVVVVGLSSLASSGLLARTQFNHFSGGATASFAATQPAPAPRSRPPEQPPSHSNNNFHLLVGERPCLACRFH